MFRCLCVFFKVTSVYYMFHIVPTSRHAIEGFIYIANEGRKISNNLIACSLANSGGDTAKGTI